jgi:hypothetical protein
MKAQFVLAFLAFVATSPLFADAPFVCRLPDDANFVSADGGCKDVVTGVVFGTSAYKRTGGSWWTYNGAKDNACPNYSVDGGFDDWRMPTKAELLAASAHGGTNYLDFVGAQNEYGPWSSDKKGNKAYWVRLFDGVTGLHSLDTGLDVLCVRKP